jgi:dihydroorotate dehydrogenase (NAD+) catalytic subunit
MDEPDLSVSLGPLKLKNPVIAASGVFGYGLELMELCPPESLGAVITKGLSLTPWEGNASPRIVEAAGGLINSIGLENMGVENFISLALEPLAQTGAVIGANIIGATIEEYVAVAQRLSDTKVDFLELNISCPNLSSEGGLSFGANTFLAAKLTSLVVKAAASKPVVVKLPPLVSDIASLAKAIESAGAAALSLINTLPGLAVDLQTRKSKLGSGAGGLSGPPIKPLALRQVLFASRAVTIPVIGLGGIFTAEDALEFLITGAAAIEVGTAILVDPTAPLSIIEGLRAYLLEKKLSLADLQGSLLL